MRRRTFGALLLVAFACLTILFYALRIQTSFEDPFFLALQLILFQSIIPFAVAYVAGYSYLKSRLPQLLVLGCATLAYGIFNSVVATGVLFVNTPEWVDFIVTIHNSGLLTFSAITLCGSIIAAYWHPSFPDESRNLNLDVILSYLLVIVFVTLFGLLTYLDLTAPFVVAGNFTPVRQAVLSATVLLLISGSIFLYYVYTDSKLNIAYWYTLGIAMTSIGAVSILIEPGLGTPLSWTGRTAQYVGCAFLLVAVVSKSQSAGVVIGWSEAFKRDKKQFDLLSSRMLDAFSFNRIVVENGKPIDYVFLATNEAFEKLTGLRRDNVIGKRVTEVLPGIENEPADWIGTFGKVAMTGQPVFFENYAEILKKWFMISAYSPKKGYFVAISEDITERKKAEESLKETEERLRLVTENSRDGINLLDLGTWKYVYMNPAQVAITGFTAEEMNGISAQEAYERTHPDDRLITTEQQRKVAAGEDMPEPVEYRWKVKSGEYRWFSDSRKLVRNDKGQAIALVGISRDITQRKKAEEDLKRRQAEIQTLFENIPAGLVLFEAKSPYKVLAHNRFYQELFDEPFRSRGMVGLNIFEYAPEVEASGVKSVFDEVVQTKKPKSFLEFPYESNPPKPTWFNWHMAPIMLDDRVVALVSMSLDVTDRHVAAEALKESEALARKHAEKLEEMQTKLEKKAQEVEKYATNMEALAQERLKKLKDAEHLATIGAIAGMVGHDIRNPLQSIVGDLYLAKKDLTSLPPSGEKEDIKESLLSIENSVDYINKIVMDLQDYAKPLKPLYSVFDLREAINELLRKNSIPKNIQVSAQIAGNASSITSDRDMLKRILGNLVNNAVQAMPEGGKLRIHGKRAEQNTVISVSDSGIGISPDVQMKLFTPLFTTKSKGQGFGLAVVKRMSEAMGGSVDFKSEMGKGTTFSVSLPSQKNNSRNTSNQEY